MPLVPLDRADPVPLWAQLEAELRRRIDAGEFSDGRFPTDLELTEGYEVSRHTVREAIRHLNKTGILKRERGRGTVINRSEFEQPLGTLYSLFQSIESTGTEQTSEVLELAVVIDSIAAARLQIDEDTELFHLARLRRPDRRHRVLRDRPVRLVGRLVRPRLVVVLAPLLEVVHPLLL